MSRIKSFVWLLVVALGLGFSASCDEKQNDTPTPPTGDPVITLNMSEISVTQEGGRFNVEYAVENPIEGKTVSITPQATWIEDMDLSLPGIMSFTVARNRTQEPRETTIDLTYEGAQPVSLPIRQERGDEPAFTNGNVTTTITSYSMDIYPKDKEKPFILMSADVDYIASLTDSDENYGTDLALFEDDMAYYKWLGENFYGKSLSAMLQEVARYGDQIAVNVTGGQPNRDYVLYAYHVDIDSCALASDVYRFEVTTANVDQVEVEFEFNVEVDEATLGVQVNPANGYNGRYYFDVLPKVLVDSELKEGQTKEDYIVIWWNTIVEGELRGGSSYSDILGNCSRGGDGYDFELLQETDYYLFSFAVDPNYAFAASTPQIEEVTTGTVSMSDLVIEVEALNIGSQGADLKYTTSNYDPYFAGYITKEAWDAYGTTDQARFEGLMSEFAFETLNGDTEVSVLGLSQETEYVAYAFGSAGGVLTTAIYYTTFTTGVQGAGKAKMSLEYPGYYNIAEVCAVDDSYSGYMDSAEDYCLFPFKVVLDPADSEVYYWDLFDRTNYDYSSEEMINSLLYSTPKDFLATVYIMPYNAPCSFAGFVRDEYGYGELCRVDFTFTKDGVAEVSTYFEFLSTMYSAPAPMRASTPVCGFEKAGVITAGHTQEEVVVAAPVQEFVPKAAVLFPESPVQQPAMDQIMKIKR